MPKDLPAHLTNILSLRDEYVETDLQSQIRAWEIDCDQRKKEKKQLRMKPKFKLTDLSDLYCQLLGRPESDVTGQKLGKVRFVFPHRFAVHQGLVYLDM